MKPGSLSILLPSSLAIDTSDLRSKTLKIGQIARAASVFRVDRIIIYRDFNLDETETIEKILRYAETPQYLRKYLFPLMDDLRYAGAIPPLKTPHHPVDVKKIEIGDVRVGVVVRVHENGSWADIGLKRYAFLDVPLQKGGRVNVRIVSTKPLKAIPVRRDEITEYWGYSVTKTASLSSTIGSGVRIATTRYGKIIDIDLLKELRENCAAKDVMIAFGAPHKGIVEIMGEERTPMSRFDYVLNTLPDQGTETVRVEEAVIATLAILNISFTDPVSSEWQCVPRPLHSDQRSCARL